MHSFNNVPDESFIKIILISALCISLSIFHREKVENQVYNNVLELVGNTPLIKLEKLPKAYNVNCDIYAKCEFFNPSGSIKDRLALGMMQDAKRKGIVNEITEYVEATSGNTGIGIALNCALSENKCIIVTEDKNSSEKVNTVKLLGAEVIQTKNNSLEISIARQLVDDLPDALMLGQFENPVNPRTHYETTAKEILSAMSPVGDIDMLVVGSGTGGTMTGVGKRLKEVNPKCLVVVNEPEGATMFNKNAKAHPFLVEGIGGTSVPLVCDESVMDHYEVISDKDAFVMARDLARMEGLLCGGSSGSAMTAAIKAVKHLFHDGGRGKSVVVILPDGIRNYMSKFVSDQWMEAYRFIDPPNHTMRWWNNPITDLIPSHKYPKLQKDYTCEQALEAMKSNNVDIGVMVDENNRYLGAVSKDGLRNRATNPTKLPGQKSEDFDFQSLVIENLDKHVHILAENAKEGKPTVGLLSRVLDITPYVVIGKEIRDYFEPSGVLTVDDVLDYIHEKSKPASFNKTWYK